MNEKKLNRSLFSTKRCLDWKEGTNECLKNDLSLSEETKVDLEERLLRFEAFFKSMENHNLSNTHKQNPDTHSKSSEAEHSPSSKLCVNNENTENVNSTQNHSPSVNNGKQNLIPEGDSSQEKNESAFPQTQSNLNDKVLNNQINPPSCNDKAGKLKLQSSDYLGQSSSTAKTNQNINPYQSYVSFRDKKVMHPATQAHSKSTNLSPFKSRNYKTNPNIISNSSRRVNSKRKYDPFAVKTPNTITNPVSFHLYHFNLWRFI